jgi:hypothetical protein
MSNDGVNKVASEGTRVHVTGRNTRRPGRRYIPAQEVRGSLARGQYSVGFPVSDQR